MIINRVDKSTCIFSYDNIKECTTHVFIIKKKNRVYVIDTFCGTESMKPVIEEIKDKEVFVINTHFHWDHVWGNSAFKKDLIISHERCRKILDKAWESQIEENKEYILGNVEKCLPTLTFNNKINFHEDGIELFHSPGHTEDSISIFDSETKTLYVGDNLEKPIIYVENGDIASYINTLKTYMEYDAERIFAGHTLNLTKKDILDTINYLEALKRGDKIEFNTDYERKIHKDNLKMVSEGEI